MKTTPCEPIRLSPRNRDSVSLDRSAPNTPSKVPHWYEIWRDRVTPGRLVPVNTYALEMATPLAAIAVAVPGPLAWIVAHLGRSLDANHLSPARVIGVVVRHGAVGIVDDPDDEAGSGGWWRVMRPEFVDSGRQPDGLQKAAVRKPVIKAIEVWQLFEIVEQCVVEFGLPQQFLPIAAEGCGKIDCWRLDRADPGW